MYLHVVFIAGIIFLDVPVNLYVKRSSLNPDFITGAGGKAFVIGLEC